MKESRYFIVYYNFPGGCGELGVISEDGTYVIKNQVKELLNKNNPGIEYFTITNIIELSKEDYDYFYSGI
jgi:hypothetical protein